MSDAGDNVLIIKRERPRTLSLTMINAEGKVYVSLGYLDANPTEGIALEKNEVKYLCEGLQKMLLVDAV